MEKNLKSFMALSLVVFAFMMCFAIMQTDAAHADAVPVLTYFGKSISVPYFSGYWYGIDVGSRFKDAKKVTIKSSNKKVFNPDPVDKDSFKYHTIYGLVKKKGSTTITVTVKKSGGTKTYKCKLKTIKYQNPFKSYKLGSKKLQSKYKKNHFASYKNTAKSAVIKIGGNKGWKVKKIIYQRYEYAEGSSKIVNKTIKNGSKINLSPDDENVDESIFATMYNKKLKQKVIFPLYIQK